MTDPDGRQPSLYDAKARVARAGEHIKSLQAEVNRTYFAGPMHPSIKTAEVSFPPSALCSILIGEIAYNLKAALDYLVFELFYLDTGEFDNRTKFIIEDTPEAWNAHIPDCFATPKREKACWLHRLSPDHQAALKRLQPFSQTRWTKALRDITNPDRHRQLVEIAGRLTYRQIERLSDARAEAIRATGFPDEMFMHYESASHITLADGQHAIEAMADIHSEIGKVIEAFDPDFQREVPKTGHDTNP